MFPSPMAEPMAASRNPYWLDHCSRSGAEADGRAGRPAKDGAAPDPRAFADDHGAQPQVRRRQRPAADRHAEAAGRDRAVNVPVGALPRAHAATPTLAWIEPARERKRPAYSGSVSTRSRPRA